MEKSRLSNSQFIKPFGKTISIQPLTSPKTYSNRNNSKRSTSLNFVDNPDTNLNESFISLNSNKNVAGNIHEMDTQPPNPIANDSTDSIYTADTQIPPELALPPSIHSVDTQLPTPTTEHLPQVRKINNQHEMQFDIYASNKEIDESIFNAETQPFPYDKNKNNSVEIINNNKNTLKDNSVSESSPKAVSKDVNTSEEELLFDDIDDEYFEEDLNSQKILTDELSFKEDAVIKTDAEKNDHNSSKRDTRLKSNDSTDCEDIDMLPTQKIPDLPNSVNKLQVHVETKNESKASKRTARIKSDSSTECEDNEDMMLTQKIPELPKNEESNTKPSMRYNRIQSDGSTDCEDIIPTQKIPENKVDDDLTDCEDDIIEIKTNEPNQSLKKIEKTKFEDMPTQIIDVDNYNKDSYAFEDMPTQIIDADIALEDQSTQIIDEVTPKYSERAKKCFNEIISPFKIPLQSPIRVKSKDIPKLTPKDKTMCKPNDDDNFYKATQDIYDDLCSQRETSPEIVRMPINIDHEVVPCSVEDYKVGDKFANIERELSPTKIHDDAKITKFIANLSSPQVRDIIGVEDQVAKLKKVPSDSSDVESTPKKVRPFLFTDSDLPNSQEIKTSMISHTRAAVTESSSESETENFSEEITPFLHRKKKTNPVVKIDLTKKFDIEKLPERVLTRQRKPTLKLMNATEGSKTLSSNILKPTYLIEQEDQIDQDIITENIKRLKTYEKAKSNKDSKNDDKVKETKKESTRKKTENKSNEPKEKLKVIIKRPKRKHAKSKNESSARRSDKPNINTSNDSLDSRNTSVKTTNRRTRSKKKEIDNKNTEKKSVSPENKITEPENKKKRTNKKREPSKSPEIEVRRSKRQKKSKEKNDDDTMQAPKSILKKSVHEQSTVYNISSSSTESPRSMKRSLVDYSDVPNPKRTRSFVNNTYSGITNSSLRATPARAMKKQHVLFTAFPSEEVKQKLEKLG